MCQIEKKKPIVQPLADLPSSRVIFAAPFECVCIDFFGHLSYRNGKKFYILIVTCLVSRMVKLEVVNSLSANSALTALNNVFLQCGTPRKIYSDNGTNFVKCNKEIKKFLDQLEESSKLDNRNIEWIFSPPGAPWYNGTVERLISVTKRCLRCLDASFRSFEDARTTFLKIESVINGRPIVQDDDRWISPFEIAYGRQQQPLIDVNADLDTNGNWPKRLKEVRSKFENFWRSQYLASLNQNNQPKITDIKIGDYVLLPSDRFIKRNKWPIAKIIDICNNSNNDDKVIRSVKIRRLSDDAEYIRPVNGMILLDRYKN